MLSKIHCFCFCFLFLVSVLLEHTNNWSVEFTYFWDVCDFAQATLAA